MQEANNQLEEIFSRTSTDVLWEAKEQYLAQLHSGKLSKEELRNCGRINTVLNRELIKRGALSVDDVIKNGHTLDHISD